MRKASRKRAAEHAHSKGRQADPVTFLEWDGLDLFVFLVLAFVDEDVDDAADDWDLAFRFRIGVVSAFPLADLAFADMVVRVDSCGSRTGKAWADGEV